MKYIAINDFSNPANSPVKLSGDQKHKTDAKGQPLKHHIHKGAQFEIGQAPEFASLTPAEKVLVAHLMVSGKIAEATDAKVKAVNAEVESDAKRDAADLAASKAVSPVTVAEVLAQLPALVAAAVAKAKA